MHDQPPPLTIPPTPAEAALILALHRAYFAPLSELFGEPYEPPSGAVHECVTATWLPLIRAHVTAATAHDPVPTATTICVGDEVREISPLSPAAKA